MAGMYYNGYMIIAIFLGQTLGFIIFGRDTVPGAVAGSVADGTQVGCC